MGAHDQEKAFEAVLARALRESLRPETPGCPGPETFAAYIERALTAAETSRCEAHLAGCARCQQVLAALASTEAEPLRRAAAELGAQRLAARALLEDFSPSEETAAEAEDLAHADTFLAGPTAKAKELVRVAVLQPARERPRAPAWRWLVPALAATLVLLVSGAQLYRTFRAPPLPSKNQMARTTAPTNAPAAEKTETAQNLQAPPPGLARGEREYVVENRNQAIMPQKFPPSAAQPALPATATGVPTGEEKARPAQKQPIEQAQADRLAAPAAAPAETTEAGKRAQAAPRLQGGTLGALQAGPGRAKEVPSQAIEVGQAPSGGLRQALAPPAAAASKSILITSPNPMVKWTVGPAGTIARSTDGGRTWKPQDSRVTSDLLAGSVPSETVCWVVGRDGIILRTTDGEHWRKVFSPGAFDWIAVEARDASHAVITSADQHHYVTSDGGQSWLVQ